MSPVSYAYSPLGWMAEHVTTVSELMLIADAHSKLTVGLYTY